MKKKLFVTFILIIVVLFILWYGYKEHIKDIKNIWFQKKMIKVVR